ncbi:unnamed protein product [Haemonchus placei]|uniref:SERPIN domain-containing protein n=1 Tax=Haemonchus placei TaxID=6290 RepID=A0A0N4WPY1_HAEPC|nr:unnamed protein product [Haemonchus placei]
MRLAILAISLLAVAYATPVVISEERVNAILEKLRRAHAIGEFAVNTPTGIYPIKDINKNNFRQIFNFAPLATKEGETTEVENHKAVAETNIDEKLATSDKDQHAPVAEGKEAVTEQAKSTEVTAVTEEKSAEASKEKATAESSTYAEKPETTKAVEESSSHAEKIETTETAAGGAEKAETTEAKIESKEVTEAKSAEGGEVSSTATVVTGKSSLEAAGEHAAEAKSGESTEKAGATVVEAKAGGEGAASRVGEATAEAHGEEGATKTLTAGHAEASFVKVGEAGTVATDKVEGSGDVHEGSGTLEETPSPPADTTTLLTGNSHETGASAEGQALPTITIPQNPEEPYIYVPVESYKGHNLPKVSYLLIPKKFESEISDYLTAKTH